MYMTIDHRVGGKNVAATPEDLSYIVDYNWESPLTMKEAVKVMLTARLDGGDRFAPPRFEGDVSREQINARLRLAGNPRCSQEVLEYLRRTGDRYVCERIALNPAAGQKTLESLTGHPAPEVRAALSENSRCPETILNRLSQDECPDVRLRLSENPNLPLSILEKLSQDDNPFVASRSRETIRRVARENALRKNIADIGRAPHFMAIAT